MAVSSVIVYCEDVDVIPVIKSIRMIMAWHVARMGERGLRTGFGGETEGKRSLGRSRYRWEDNIQMVIQEVGWGMDWIVLAKNRDR